MPDTTLLNDAAAPVVFDEIAGQGGQRIGRATLSVEKTLNSLSLEMVDLLQAQLDRWRDDPDVPLLLVEAAGDRAFCAGGDIQALYHAIRANQAAGAIVETYAEDFFEREYRLDYTFHTYPKPIVCVGHGIVMGGGLGLFCGSSHRLATERTRVALPEITIGLFPDAGATWFFHGCEPWAARLMGLTGVNLNGADSVALGLATHCVDSAIRTDIADQLASVSWPADAHAAVSNWCDGLPGADVASEVVARRPVLEAVFGHEDLAELIAALESAAADDEWLARGRDNLLRGCPTTAHVVMAQVPRARTSTIEACFQLELNVATHCARYADFAEGVRALLIDKDNAPTWTWPDLDNVPAEHVASHFEPVTDPHPLADLGAQN